MLNLENCLKHSQRTGGHTEGMQKASRNHLDFLGWKLKSVGLFMQIFMDFSQQNENLSKFRAGQYLIHVIPNTLDSYGVFLQHHQNP